LDKPLGLLYIVGLCWFARHESIAFFERQFKLSRVISPAPMSIALAEPA
jgi:hypothetical protein